MPPPYRFEFIIAVGHHAINGALLQPPAAVAAFDLDDTYAFRISGPGQRWSLAELLIDLPGYCSLRC